jgi:hypothetical protein
VFRGDDEKGRLKDCAVVGFGRAVEAAWCRGADCELF